VSYVYQSSATLGTNTDPFVLGAYSINGSQGNYLNGMLDEWGVWTRVLSSAEISQLYNGGNGLAYSSPASTQNNYALLHLDSQMTESFNPDGSHVDKATGYVYATSTDNLIKELDYGQVGGNPDGTFNDTNTSTTTTCSNNIVGYWPLDESSGVAHDSTPDGNNLTNNNTVTYAAGKINNGANFVRASSQYLSEPNASEVGLKITGNLTVAGWVKFATLPASNNYYGLLNNYQNNGGYGFYFANLSGTYSLQSQLYGNVNQGAVQTVAWTPSVNTWYYVALTYNTSGSNNVKFYVNGVQQGTTQTDTDTALIASDGIFALGAHGSGVNFLNGSLDEWGVWNRELSPTEISQLYNGGNGLAYGAFSALSTTTTYADVIQNLNYSYDADGNITGITDLSQGGSGKSVTLSYDPLNRLISASTTAASSTPYLETFAYNPLGGLTNKSDVGSYTYALSGDANPDAPTTVGTTTYSYDNDGNLTSASPWSYQWDYRNRMTKSSNGSTATTYGYDFLNNRVFQGTGSATTTYPNKYFALVTTAIGSSTLATSTNYIFSGSQLLGTIEGGKYATTTRYMHSDILGSTDAVTNASGTPVQMIDYLPYGSTRIASSTAGTDEKHKYIGQFTDNSGLSYLNARYYETFFQNFDAL